MNSEEVRPTEATSKVHIGRRSLLLGSAAIVLAGCSNGRTADSADQAGGSATTIKAAGSATGGDGGAGSSTVESTASSLPEACVLTPELTAGPYHLDGHLARKDITEGMPGEPLEFRVHVLNADGCAPLVGAAVDVWHCDAGGEYSGFNGNSLEATQAGGRNDKRFLRGVQLTDSEGIAEFSTIFPGWYEGRAVHIHLQVLEGGELDRTYEGGHVAHVGQAFFDEATTAAIMDIDPYSAHRGARTSNDDDSIFRQAGPGAVVRLTNAKGANGYRAEFTCVVDPAATPPPAPLF